MNQEILIEIFKKVSLFDLSEAQFETFNDLDDHWTINASNGERVYDAMKYDGNLFWMMNNNGSFSLLNPMSGAFEILLAYQPSKVQKLRSTLETIKLRVAGSLYKDNSIYQLCDEVLKETET